MTTRRWNAAWFAAIACAMVFVRGAGAQMAPAGNAHPETRAVSEEAASLPNPFGAIEMFDPASPGDPRTKHAFAAEVDVSPLRTVAVFHDGRVKTLETLADETVHRIAGRKDYFDVVEVADGKREKLHYDPLFTLIDLIIDPAYYVDKNLVHINYLPLRRALLSAAYGEATTDGYVRGMALTRVSPRVLLEYGPAIEQKYEFEDAYRRAFSRIGQAINIWREGSANMLLIPPAGSDQAWVHLSRLPDDAPARRAATELGAAWRAGDATRVNAAIIELARAVRGVNPEAYPTQRVRLESAYNRLNAFEWAMWLYAFSLVTLLLAFGTGRSWLKGLGVVLLVASVGMHAAGFTLRCLIAERFAIQNQFESMTGLSLFAALVGLAMLALKRQWLFAAATAGVGFMVLTGATQTGIPGRVIEREAAILNTSVLLKYHVTIVLTSYGLISLGFITSLFYLGAYYAGTFRRLALGGSGATPAAVGGAAVEGFAGEAVRSGDAAPRTRARLLSDLDTATMTVLQLAFWALGVGILLGAWWADHSWGRWWAFDPKETWALITWIVYLIVIHVRFTLGQKKGLATAWLSVAGFIVMLWTYKGVNLLLPGLHAYA
ncbi:MAG: cytochrome c biogenesis protein CcsA [Phycisphaerales bacterium]|jgi:cytochrome c-type biogenesis protein CcsB|nr:cytochrome c biogenesis protein CcsA [Phycisphaerales bacterium]